MKTTTIYKFAILIFMVVSMSTIKAATTIVPDHDYFKTFRKNEQPENIKFKLLDKNSKQDKEGDFYVIFVENENNQGVYFKVVLNEMNKPIATYYAKENKNINLDIKNLNNLKRVSNSLLGKKDSKALRLAPDPQQCVVNCHRTKGCYDKPTELGVLLCSADCQLSCVSK